MPIFNLAMLEHKGSGRRLIFGVFKAKTPLVVCFWRWALSSGPLAMCILELVARGRPFSGLNYLIHSYYTITQPKLRKEHTSG